jgi:hypothetical protein
MKNTSKPSSKLILHISCRDAAVVLASFIAKNLVRFSNPVLKPILGKSGNMV